MKADFNIKHKIGDVITVSNTGKTGQIIEINNEKETALVYYENTSKSVEWIPLKGNNYFKREYKIMNLTQHQNVLVAELSHVEKIYDNSYNCYSQNSLNKVDIFLIPMNHIYSKNFIENPEGNKQINFMYFFLGKINFDGNIVDAYYSTDLATYR